VIELLTNAEMAEADRLAIAGGISAIDLTENAGRAVADWVAKNYPSGTRVVVVAGPGNNGGDGYVAARLLAGRGGDVRVLRAGGAKLKRTAAQAAKRWSGSTEEASPAAFEGAGVIIDAVFGAGLDRVVDGEMAALIGAMNGAGVPVIAVDLPSGINGTTGAVMGTAVKATDTVTFFRRKPGHLLLPGRLHCGQVHVAQIGIPDGVLEDIQPRLFANVPALWARCFPVPRVDGHKYMRGHAVVVSGDISHTGAARLAARGALRAGAGLITIASPREALAVNATSNLAVMVRPIDGPAELSQFLRDPRLNAIVLGPGGGVGPAMRELVVAALTGDRAVVLDADALTSFAADPDVLAKAIKAQGNRSTIITPHEGEFDKLFYVIDEVSKVNSKHEKTRIAARYSGATVLFKGADTVVASADGRVAIADNAPPWLATAGSGDVLAGLIAGLLAQGMPAFEAAAAAAWIHGEAGTELGPGLIAEDLPEVLPAVYRRLFADISAGV
jgi:hydroxyethylthiazole kinase-like uncharacterized protein yjeF